MSTAEDYRGQGYDPRQERPIAGLFADLFRETATLIRTEIELAKTELSAKAGEAAGGAVFIAAGGLVAFLGAIFLLAAATLALAQVVAPWLAALIVGGVVTAIGVVLMLMGRNRLKPRNLQPERTLETLREDKRWARSQLGR
ncbi:MAG TPA: phage holin family protein [Azospirillum sp.]